MILSENLEYATNFIIFLNYKFESNQQEIKLILDNLESYKLNAILVKNLKKL